ncbi:MAG: HD domain-containing protein [Candidatus Omnitrophica bacterium]|nr:HD domain-containing protein [Candidatus Omnitrophota bacterium]
MSVTDKIKVFFRDLMSSLQSAQIYTTCHPKFNESLDKTYSQLKDILSSREHFTIGIVGDEIAFESEIFFDLSNNMRQVVSYLKEKGVEKLSFCRGVKRDELIKFLEFLMISKGDFNTETEEYFLTMGIRNISAGKLSAEAGEPISSVKSAINYLKRYEGSMDKIADSLTKMLDSGTIDSLELGFTVTNVMENLIGRYHEFFKLTTVKQYDLGTFRHILNVSVLSMHFAVKLGFVHKDCLDIGIAALFHDIGKLYVSRKIIQKSDKLAEEEFDKMRSHTLLGAEILLKNVDSLGTLPVIVAFEHHLRYNLKGYPKVPFAKAPHVASLLISVCDVYDALIQRRSYKRSYPPEMIYNLMMRERGNLFDPKLLDMFFNIMGVWPIGTIVELSDATVAIVREINESDKFSPKVEVVHPSKSGIMDLGKMKNINIEKSLNPFAEGKQFVDLV